MAFMKFIKSLALPSEMLPPIIEEESHFDPETEHSAAKLGMWLFLATELLLFGGLFAAYAIFRAKYPEMFLAGSESLDVVLGTINTVILIFSSYTVAIAVSAIQENKVYKMSIQYQRVQLKQSKKLLHQHNKSKNYISLIWGR